MCMYVCECMCVEVWLDYIIVLYTEGVSIFHLSHCFGRITQSSEYKVFCIDTHPCFKSKTSDTKTVTTW